MYVSWHKQTFPLRISAEERRTTWHMLSISTVSDYHFLKSTFCSRKTREREKCYKSTQKKKHVLRNPNSFAFCNILCKRANKVSSDGAMCSVKRLLSWDDTQLSLREAKSGSFFSRWVCRTWLFNQRGTRDYGLLVQILISIICSRNINPWLLINCVVWHLKLVTVPLKKTKHDGTQNIVISPRLSRRISPCDKTWAAAAPQAPLAAPSRCPAAPSGWSYPAPYWTRFCPLAPPNSLPSAGSPGDERSSWTSVQMMGLPTFPGVWRPTWEQCDALPLDEAGERALKLDSSTMSSMMFRLESAGRTQQLSFRVVLSPSDPRSNTHPCFLLWCLLARRDFWWRLDSWAPSCVQRCCLVSCCPVLPQPCAAPLQPAGVFWAAFAVHKKRGRCSQIKTFGRETKAEARTRCYPWVSNNEDRRPELGLSYDHFEKYHWSGKKTRFFVFTAYLIKQVFLLQTNPIFRPSKNETTQKD